MNPDLVYVVINRYTSFIYGVYLDLSLAQAKEAEMNNALGHDFGHQPPVRLTVEPVLYK